LMRRSTVKSQSRPGSSRSSGAASAVTNPRAERT
jgi:hypothetical protein